MSFLYSFKGNNLFLDRHKKKLVRVVNFREDDTWFISDSIEIAFTAVCRIEVIDLKGEILMSNIRDLEQVEDEDTAKALYI